MLNKVVLGKRYPKAASIPIKAPEAPTVAEYCEIRNNSISPYGLAPENSYAYEAI
jgi:hypothetical protein